MNHLRLIAIVVCLLTLAGLAMANRPSEDNYQKGFAVIKIAVGYPDLNSESLRNNSQLAPLADVLASIDYSSVKRSFPHCQPPRPGGADLTRIYNVTFQKDYSILNVCSLLAQTGLVEYAEPRGIYRAVMDYNDTWVENEGQYGLDLINASEAHDLCVGNPSSFIGIIDTGFDMDHEDLAPNLWINPGEDLNGDGRITNEDLNERDDDGNGMIDDFHGWDFMDEDNTPEDTHAEGGHGTHCGGIASAATNNERGVASIGYNCSLLPVRVGAGREILYGLEGIVYAVDVGCRVISCSWGGDEAYQEALDVVRYAREHGALVIAAAGNDNHADFLYPASYAEVMAIAATNNRDRRANFSNFGDWITLSAPGVDILSTYTENRYAYSSGTSMSAPFVAGLAGLMLSYNPDLTDQEVWDILVATSDNIDGINPNYRGRLGAGRINARAAMQAATPPPEIGFEPEAFDIELPEDVIREFTLTISNQGRGNLFFSIALSPADVIWIELDPFAGQLASGESEDIPFVITTFDSRLGNYEAEILIISNDPDHPQQTIPLALTVTEGQNGHFPVPPPSDESHTLLIQSLTYHGEPAPSGWEVGALTANGYLAGCGVWSAVNRLGFVVYGDDPETQVIEGYLDNDEFSFQVWDNRNEVLYTADAEFFVGPDRWHNMGFSALNLSVTPHNEMITVRFSTGWNMISINVSPGQDFYVENEDRGPDVRLMLDQLRDEEEHHVQLFKNGVGQFYSPEFDFCNIPYWDLRQGYQICVDDYVFAIWSGEAIPADQPITLTDGWNLVAYYPTYQLDASAPDFYVLSSIIDFVDVAKDGPGRFLSPEWVFSNMLPWREGQGYQIRIVADEPIALRYPAEEGRLLNATGNSFEKASIQSSENMSLLVILPHLTAGTITEVAAVNTEGGVCGRGMVDADGRCGIAVWGDEPTTEEIEGLKPGEAFTLEGIHRDGRSTPLDINRLLNDRKLVYETNGFCAVEAVEPIVMPTTTALQALYPNPFNACTVVTFDLMTEAEVQLQATDLQGRAVATLAQGRFSAGAHQTQWNGENLPAGLYLVTLTTEGRSVTRKAVLLK